MKKEANYALNNRYPIDTKEQVIQGCEYFEKYAREFNPSDRRTYALNIQSRAEELGIPLTGTVAKYASVHYNPDLKAHLSMRAQLVDGKMKDAYEKIASYQEETDPDVFANTLYELDKRAGLDKYYDTYLQDPFYSTLGSVKVASYVYDKDGILISENDLKEMVESKREILKSYFGQTLVDGLAKEGVSAFEALPSDTKDVIARIWNGEVQ